MIEGSCLCGAITFKTDAQPKGASMCHCSQCRKQSGGIWSSAHVPVDALTISGPVSWYAASPNAKRGSCPVCGSFLFWQGTGEDHISFALGAVDGPTGVTLEKHIFVADKGDYYQIADGLPQEAQ
ncbi:GFA family protein [Aliiroseovarius sp. KMU-50]|uniref:GFA family protein n=1 Tax=Aliiroseovarius salicola TaxID=3009082 RepID=A0ABT4VX82_9RHOB|nr:GFA family protein [Aliiroseovarius sp. KMU-50]MDA5092870.1 GFA family protein [Aliiroseovarius sp. KMU-50]